MSDTDPKGIIAMADPVRVLVEDETPGSATIYGHVNPDDLARAIREGVDARLRALITQLRRPAAGPCDGWPHESLSAADLAAELTMLVDPAPREPAPRSLGMGYPGESGPIATPREPAQERQEAWDKPSQNWDNQDEQERQEAPTHETHVDKALAWDTMHKASIRARAAGFAEGVEAAARHMDGIAAVYRRDETAARAVGCEISDSGGVLGHYASKAEGYAAAIRALTPPTPTPDPLLPGLRYVKQNMPLFMSDRSISEGWLDAEIARREGGQ